MTDIEDIYELSPMQQGILFHTLYDRESSVYFGQLSCTFHTDLDVTAFKNAWQVVTDRHAVLRSSFYWVDLRKPLQAVHRHVDFPWEFQDWSQMSDDDQQERLDDFLAADRTRGFDLEEPPLMRAFLIRMGVNDYRFIWSHHHLLFDGWSIPIILKEVLASYEAERSGANITIEKARPYREYISWLQQQDVVQAEAFWRQELRGLRTPTRLTEVLTLPLQTTEKETFAEQTIRLNKAASSALYTFARRHHITVSTILQAAWAILLYRYSGESQISFGVTVSGRPPSLPGVENMVGLFLNTLPAHFTVRMDRPLIAWLKEVQTKQAARERFAYTSLVDIQGWSDVPRGTPLFESILVYQNFPLESMFAEGTGSLPFEAIRDYEWSNYPLALVASPGPELNMTLAYDATRFDQGAIERMLGHVRQLLSDMLSDPERPIAALQMLTPSERHQLIVDWNNTFAEWSTDVCVHDLFERKAAQTPDALAVVQQDNQLTYRELNQRANHLARYLQQLGVGPEKLVGLCMERSPDMIVALLGILKAGGGYLPLDPIYPPNRLSFILEDADLSIILVQEHLKHRIPTTEAMIIDIDSVWDGITNEDAKNLARVATPENIAYLIYTSGSTGKPKGVMTEHRSLANYIQAANKAFELRSSDRVLQYSSISFDTAAEEIFPCLSAGGTLILRTDTMLSSIPVFMQSIGELGITVLDLPTVYWHRFIRDIESHDITVPSSLRLVIIGGEAARRDAMEMWRRQVGSRVRLLNTYGPTETTIVATLWELPESREVLNRYVEVPIGRPMANMQAYVLDSRLEPTPIGVAGELHVGGAGVTRGYLNRPQLTAKRFVADPYHKRSEARLYKTGDLACYTADGDLLFLGRNDHQVKIRGFRIELGEIEATLLAHPAISQAVVIDREDAAGDKRLVAYLVSDAESPPDRSELRQRLEQRLPHYMIIWSAVYLDAIPLTPSGKVDRRALPEPEKPNTNGQQSYVAPCNEIESTVAMIWSEVLGVDKIDINGNFFDLGGHSLLAMRIMVRIYEELEIEVPLRSIFESPTVAEVASTIAELQRPSSPIDTVLDATTSVSEPDFSSVMVPIKPHGSRPPLFCIHPAGGVVFPYYGLAIHLDDDQPLFALQDPSYDGSRQPYDLVEELASHYVEAIKVIQPEGPYHLAGWSFGGTLAFEMAQQLHANGDSVDLLGMMDTAAPLPETAIERSSFARLKSIPLNAWIYLVTAFASLPHIWNGLYLLVAGALRRKPTYTSQTPIKDRIRWYWLNSWRSYFLKRANMAEYITPDSDLLLVELPGTRQVMSLVQHHTKMEHRYIPQVYAGKVTLFQAEQPLEEVLDPDPTLGWTSLAAGGVDVRPIPGNHVVMLSEPFVRDFARAITASLDDSKSDPPHALPSSNSLARGYTSKEIPVDVARNP